jgi:anthranilate phosphoribosyltransferase
LLMGVSLVMELMGKVKTPLEGIQATKKILDNGEAMNFLMKFRKYFLVK